METFVDKLSRKEKKILNYFVKHPTSQIHLRGLAEETGVSHTWVRKVVSKFESAGLVEVEKSYDFRIRARREDDLFKAIKMTHNLLTLHDLADYLEKEYHHPEAIVVFGSYAKGEDIEKSDIDVAIITNKRKGV